MNIFQLIIYISVITASDDKVNENVNASSYEQNAGINESENECNHLLKDSTGDDIRSSISFRDFGLSGGEENDAKNNSDRRMQDILETQKNDILMRLGFKHLPHVSRENLTDHDLRRIMWHFRQSEEAIRDLSSNTIYFRDDHLLSIQFYSFTDTGYRPSASEFLSDGKSVYFDINIYKPLEAKKQTIVNSAALKLYKSYVKPELIISGDFVDKSVAINILQISRNTSGLFKQIIASRLVSLDTIGWEEFDVTKTIREWLNDSSSNFGFEVVCDDRYDMEELIHFVTSNDTLPSNINNSLIYENVNESENSFPILNIVTRSIEISEERMKRSAVTKLTNENQSEDSVTNCEDSTCCNHSYNISFSDIGWHWVIHPKIITLYTCSCDHEPPMCKSSRRDKLSLVHYDDNSNLLLSFLPDIIPMKCGCDDN